MEKNQTYENYNGIDFQFIRFYFNMCVIKIQKIKMNL